MPDEKLTEAKLLLSLSCYRTISRLHCFWDGDTLVLTGTVETYYLKQMAQETVRPLKVKIDNRIVVIGSKASLREPSQEILEEGCLHG